MTAVEPPNASRPAALAEKDPNTVAARPTSSAAASPTESSSPSTKQGAAAAAATSKPARPAQKENSSSSKKRKSDIHDDSQSQDQDEGDEGTPTNSTKKRKTNTGTKTSSSPAKASPSAEALLDVSGVTLPGEDLGTVPVYETCDGARRKIRDLLKKDGVTQAGFCRALGRAGGVPDEEAPPPRQLARFMEKKGPMKGNTNVVFYASYVLLEKMRIRDGKAKGKFRTEMEEKHKERGVRLDTPSDAFVTVKVGDKPSWDRYGLFQIKRNPNRRETRGWHRVRCG